MELFEEVGGHIGLPTLRGVFSELPRCELVELQAAYRRHVRRHNQVMINKLTWPLPGTVWAVDHAEPPQPIDGHYDAILAVRDLASGMQLAWLPVPDETAACASVVLAALFWQYGPPLVLKSDNGSAFKGDDTQRLLDEWHVSWLPSPPRTPSYNGSCEAGIGSLKTRTIFQAAKHGDAFGWTSDDLEAARRQANELHRPNGHNAPTAEQVWQTRETISDHERKRLRKAIDRNRNRILESKRRRGDAHNKNSECTIQRIATRQALVEFGLLTFTRRSITLPIKPKKLAKIL